MSKMSLVTGLGCFVTECAPCVEGTVKLTNEAARDIRELIYRETGDLLPTVSRSKFDFGCVDCELVARNDIRNLGPGLYGAGRIKID